MAKKRYIRRFSKRGKYFVDTVKGGVASEKKWKLELGRIKKENSYKSEFYESLYSETKAIAPYQVRFDIASDDYEKALKEKYFNEDERDFLTEEFTPKQEKKIMSGARFSTREVTAMFSDIKSEMLKKGRSGKKYLFELIDEKGEFIPEIYLQYPVTNEDEAKAYAKSLTTDVGDNLEEIIVNEGLEENYFPMYKIMSVWLRSQEILTNGTIKISYSIRHATDLKRRQGSISEWRAIGTLKMADWYYRNETDES